MRDQAIRKIGLLLGAAVCAMMAGLAEGQAYPTKPIRMIAPYPPAGTSDILARIVGQKLIEAWGERVVVDNRPGASGSLGTEIAATATPDARRPLILDLALPARSVDYVLLRDLAALGPTGPGNPDPVVGVHGLTVTPAVNFPHDRVMVLVFRGSSIASCTGGKAATPMPAALPAATTT